MSYSYMAEPAPALFNMAAYCVGRAAAATPDKPALIVIADVASPRPAEVWTFGHLETAILRIAGGLQAAGLKPGARIVIRLENTSAYALMFFGAIAGGYVPLPASSQLTPREAAFLVTDSDAAAVALSPDLPIDDLPPSVTILTAADIARMMSHAAPGRYAGSKADDPAFLVYTSGTTANPKGVLHAHRSAWGRRPMYQGWYGISPTDRILHAGAFNWTYTLGSGLTDPWANGATSIVYTGTKDPTLWPRLIAVANATLFAAVPSVFRQILKYAKPSCGELGQLRHGLIAGETPPPGLFEEWSHATGTELYEALGMSEISTYVSSSPAVPRKPGAVGKAQPGRSVVVLPEDGGTEPLPAGHEGLLAVHRTDPGLMLGYWKRPIEEREVFRGEWFIGGDLAIMDKDGYVSHLGRANDVMKALGYRVAPQEVEAVLARHPAVAEVACAEMQVRNGVSVIAAYIVPRDPALRDASSFNAFADANLAPYKRPREFVFVDALPRTANGKVRRRELSKAHQNVTASLGVWDGSSS